MTALSSQQCVPKQDIGLRGERLAIILLNRHNIKRYKMISTLTQRNFYLQSMVINTQLFKVQRAKGCNMISPNWCFYITNPFLLWCAFSGWGWLGWTLSLQEQCVLLIIFKILMTCLTTIFLKSTNWIKCFIKCFC